MFCRYCGKEMQEGQEYCGHCGRKNTPGQQKKQSPLLIIACVVCVVILGIAAAVSVFFGRKEISGENGENFRRKESGIHCR